MLANHLPDQKEIVGPRKRAHFSLEEVERARAESIVLIEDYVGVDILQRERTEEYHLSPGIQTLTHRPVQRMEIDDRKDFFMNKDLGLFESELHLGIYTIKYTTGYKVGDLPALFKELIIRLARFRLTGEDTELEDARTIMKVVKEKEVEKERKRISNEIA